MKKTTIVAFALLATLLSEAQALDARRILNTSGVQGGLVVVIGWERGQTLNRERGQTLNIHFTADFLTGRSWRSGG